MKNNFETLFETILGTSQTQASAPTSANSFSLTHPDTAKAMQSIS